MSTLVADVQAKVQAEVLRESDGRRIYWQVYSLPKVQADPILLRHVLASLLSNAVASTRFQSRAIIEIGSREANGEAIIFVRDNGVGFDPAYVEKLYNGSPRQHPQNEWKLTRSCLAEAQSGVSKLGGRIWAESQPGNSTTFYFALPAKRNLPEQRRAASGARA